MENLFFLGLKHGVLLKVKLLMNENLEQVAERLNDLNIIVLNELAHLHYFVH